MSIKAVLFDIDGTLIDSNSSHVDVWDEVFRQHGYVIDHAAIRSQIGKGGDMLVPFLIQNADKVLTKRLVDRHGQIFKDRYLSHMQPFAGARDLLVRAYDAGQKVVLASSASRAELDYYLELLDARKLVAATTSGDDVESSKPSPDIFATAVKKVAPLRPVEVIVVGDTPYDAEAASKCGIKTIALRSGGFSDEALNQAGAAALYDDAAALLADYHNSLLGH